VQTPALKKKKYFGPTSSLLRTNIKRLLLPEARPLHIVADRRWWPNVGQCFLERGRKRE
jgi:hypothetical protein